MQRRSRQTLNKLYQGDCLKVLQKLDPVSVIFADPPDNIGLGYDHYDDKLADAEYVNWLNKVLELCVLRANVVWFSFNAKWTFQVGRIFESLIYQYASGQGPTRRKLLGKACVQVFTFGQHNKHDLGNNHRPLWRLMWDDAPLYPDAIKVQSWRQRNGDKRAAPSGRVPGDVFDMQYRPWMKDAHDAPAKTIKTKARSTRLSEKPIPFLPQVEPYASRGMWPPDTRTEEGLDTMVPQPGDVFDFPRVTGNSQQRCDWHPTQLHEELVKRALLLTTAEGDTVLDPFGGTGTTLRVCKEIKRPCTLIELDPAYCKNIRKAHPDLKFYKS